MGPPPTGAEPGRPVLHRRLLRRRPHLLLRRRLGVGILSPLGRPLTQHTFQQHAWFHEEHAFYNLLQAAGLWAFDPVKRDWKLVTKTTPKTSDIHSWKLTYDPGLKTVIALNTQGDPGVFVFGRDTRTFTKKWPVPVKGYHVYSTCDAARKRHVVFGCQKWWTLDAVTGESKMIADLGAARIKAGLQAPHYEQGSLSLEYDPATKDVLALIKPKSAVEVWAYHADQDQWSQVTMAGEAPRGSTDFDLLVYDRDHHCHLFLNVLGVTGYKGGPVGGFCAFRYAKPREKE